MTWPMLTFKSSIEDANDHIDDAEECLRGAYGEGYETTASIAVIRLQEARLKLKDALASLRVDIENEKAELSKLEDLADARGIV